MRKRIRSARIGQWYLRPDQGEVFQVISYDQRSRVIEILTFEGNLDEIDEASWEAMALIPVALPDEYSGASDGGESDDQAGASDEAVGSNWPATSEETTAEDESEFDLQTGEPAHREPIDGAWELDDAWD